MRILPSSLSILALVAAWPAQGAEITTPSKMTSVTIFPDNAKMTRSAEADLPAGDTLVVLHGLPMTMDPNSVRVSGTSTAALRINGVETTIAAPVKPDSAAATKLDALKQERASLQTKIDALEVKRAMITRFAQSGPDRKADDLPIEKWNAAWDQVATGMAGVAEDLRQARAKAQELDVAIAAADPARIAAPAQSRDITILLNADTAAKASFTISYFVSGAGWQPVYDARLDTAKRSLDLTRRAAIRQKTGEDWSGLDVTLSTIRTNRSTAAPQLGTERLNFYEPVPVALEAAKPAAAPMAKMQMNAGAAADAPAPAQTLAAAPPPQREAEESVAQSAVGTYAASYHLPAPLDLPSGVSQKLVTIAAKPLTAKLKLLATPALDPTAFLSVEATNELDGPLLPGEVSLLRDETYLGKGTIPFTEQGDTVTLGFGADDKVKITRAPVKKKENEPVWYNQTKTETREYKTSVKNLHDFPVSIQIQDRIPVSENTAITVEQLALTTQPTEKQVGDKRGVMSWTLDLAPAESKDIRLGYKIKYPADHDIISTQ